MSKRLIAAASALALSLVASAVSAQDFQALARQDLQSAHDQLAANHPAVAVPGEASNTFRGWVDAGLAEAMGQVGRVNSGDAHAYLMRFYATGFRDSNIRMEPTFEGMGPFFATSWPGFTTGWRDGKYVVTYVKPGVRGAPPIGSAVTECNLRPVEEYARDRLDGWEGDLNTEAGRINTAPYLLWNRNNPFSGSVPSLCSFSQNGRRAREFEIKLVPIVAGDIEAAYRATVYTPPAQPLAIETVNGRPWLHVHSFADTADWRAFNGAVESQVAAIRGPAGFVLDLRGASGNGINSSTARGYGLANRIWTPEFTVSRQPSAGDLTYRATQGNRDWYAAALGRMQADPVFASENPSVVTDTQAVVAAFDAALAAGQQTFTAAGRAGVADTGAANPVAGPVIVLVDAGCSGGCLDTLDLLSKLPNVRIAGSTTASDSIFIEPTVERLPSNYSELSYGHKAWTSRVRPNNQPYIPAAGLAYAGNPTDETAVRTWVGTLF